MTEPKGEVEGVETAPTTEQVSDPAQLHTVPLLATRSIESQRQSAFDYLVEKLGPTDLGRRLGLSRFGRFADLRSSIPVYRADQHLTKVEAALGFGPVLGNSLGANDPGAVERAEVIERWLVSLKAARRMTPRRCFRLGVESDPALARWEREDILALIGPEGELEVARAKDPQECLAALRDFEADALIAPSLASVAWLESHGRARIEALVPTLRTLFAQHDLDAALRSRLPIISQGLLHPAGRLSLPAALGGEVPHAGRLGWSSCLIELLREDESTHMVVSGPPPEPVLPEHAVLGERYELVLSSGAGFLRMRSSIYVRIVGFEAVRDSRRLVPVPVVVLLPPPPEELALEGVRLDGATLTAALRQAFEREDPALVAAEIGGAARDAGEGGRAQAPGDSGFFDGTELGALDGNRSRRRPLGLELRVEVQGRSREDFAARLAERFDAIVRRRNPAYDYLRGNEELRAPVVVIVAGGSERRAAQARASSFRGTVARPQIRVASPNAGT